MGGVTHGGRETTPGRWGKRTEAEDSLGGVKPGHISLKNVGRFSLGVGKGGRGGLRTGKGGLSHVPSTFK